MYRLEKDVELKKKVLNVQKCMENLLGRLASSSATSVERKLKQ